MKVKMDMEMSIGKKTFGNGQKQQEKTPKKVRKSRFLNKRIKVLYFVFIISYVLRFGNKVKKMNGIC